MDHKDTQHLIGECLSAELSAHEARDRAERLLGSFQAVAKDDIARAIASYNASGRGTYVYDEHETKVSVVSNDGKQTVCVVVTLGTFTVRASRRTLMPREAWDLSEDRLVGELRNYLADHVLWIDGCSLSVYPPLDYDLFTADPEL